ncbi:MAG: protein BatD, partial [Verrucomicrobiaceae bacterium]
MPCALSAEVRAAFAHDVTVPNEPVRLEIRVEGGQPSAPPREIRAEGLTVSYIGSSQSNQISFSNGRMRAISEVIYNYRVTPDRVGTFTVPAVEIEIDGKPHRTQPVALRVENDRRGGGGGEAPITRIGFAEIVLPKQTAYIGESLPIQVRLYVDSRINWQPESMPSLEGEGFTKTKMPEPEQKREERDGKLYDVLIFRTAITPSRAGTLKVGPTELPFQAQIPRAQPNRRRSGGGFFGEDFFNDPTFGGFGAVERRVAKADMVELEVKPLPVAGRPESFSGAVGDFSISADGNPKTVKVGDPLTVNVSITGEGNFDRMGAPVLVDSAGWRTYPPSSNFQPEGKAAFRGTKTFQIAAIPETKKTQMPQFEFSYFDPNQEQYVTKKTEPAPLTVQGTAAPPPAPVAKRTAAADRAPKAPTPEADKNTPLTDILAIRYDIGQSRSFIPLYEKDGFKLLQLIPMVVLFGLIG